MPLDPDRLRQFVPIDALNAESLRQLAAAALVNRLQAGERLFAQGDTDVQAVYLLSGEVELHAAAGEAPRRIAAGSDEARYALANLKPRQYTGTATSEVECVRVDSEVLDRLLTWDQVGGIEVTELSGDASDATWMPRLLQTQVFLRLPAANLQALFARFTELPVKSGQIIVRQGEAGDYFYVIKRGRCRVVHKPAQGTPAALADLTEGDCFGEEALLAAAPRNATVAMLTEGSLMRLAKADFDALLAEPSLQRVGAREAEDMVRAGAGLLDVRLPAEYRAGSLRHSVNLPLFALRSQAAQLDPKRRYIVFCDTGGRSSAAAFLLEQRGFDVYVLEGGVNALPRPEPGTRG